MNLLKKFSVLFIISALLLSFSACSKNGKADSFGVNKSEEIISASADVQNVGLCVSKAKDKQSLTVKSDMTELYFDRENCTVSVYDTASGAFWTSLPLKDIGVKTSALSVTVLIDGNKYTLSSQSDSVGFSSALYEEKDGGVTVNYSFKRTLDDGTKIDLYIPISYVIKDGALSVELDCENIVSDGHDRDVIVTDIDILPFFGCSVKGEIGDYILLPDGCGVTVNLAENPESFENISLPVYENGVHIAAFGVKMGDGAFAAMVDEGEEISAVKAVKALSGGGYNGVWSSFEITETVDDGNRVYVANESYKGKIRVLYRFLSFENASYTGMAGAVRELLIRNGKLLSQSVSADGAFPFNLGVVFENNITDSKGKKLSQTLTTYSQAQEILDSLKAKGADRINLRMKGFTDGEKFSSDAGSKKELESLLAYSLTGTDFYADASVITAPSSDDAALSPDGQKSENNGIKGENISEKTGGLLSFLRKNGIGGVCISDAGKFIYSDHTENGVMLKNQISEIISRELAAVSASERLMVDAGNIYSVKYADIISQLSMTAKLQDTALCTRVPFIQAVLHGLVEYTSEPINLVGDSERAFLKAVEYGAMPYYEWYASDLSTQESTDSGCYINSISSAQSQYERAAKAFEGIRDARITDHYRVRKNVFCTVYGNGTEIYVNYNTEAVTVNGVIIDPMNFIRIN